MIISLLLPDFYHMEILSITGVLAITSLMCIAVQVPSYNAAQDKHIILIYPPLMMMIVLWGVTNR